MPENRTGPARVQAHAVEVLDAAGRHARTVLMRGGRYWPAHGEPIHPRHGAADRHGVIHHNREAV